MAAEGTKLRVRAQDYTPGEHVWVPSTFFDNPKAAEEARFSASVMDNKVYGLGAVGTRLTPLQRLYSQSGSY